MYIYQQFLRGRDPVSSYSHFLGACLSFLAMSLVIGKYAVIPEISPVHFVGSLIFCFSMLALYSTSCIYHFVNASKSILERLRKLDHSMIYVLIAGTYTPIVLKFLPMDKAVSFLMVFWGITLAAILVKILWMNAPRWLSTAFYLLMGWAVVLNPSLLASMPTGSLVFLCAGGLCYSVGAAFYIAKKPNFNDKFGFHELFHIFVILGTLSHFLLVYLFVI